MAITKYFPEEINKIKLELNQVPEQFNSYIENYEETVALDNCSECQNTEKTFKLNITDNKEINYVNFQRYFEEHILQTADKHGENKTALQSK